MEENDCTNHCIRNHDIILCCLLCFLILLLDGIWKYMLGIIPFLLSAVMVKVCIERISEIRKGEEDDIGKY